jgi:hypothetical protein
MVSEPRRAPEMFRPLLLAAGLLACAVVSASPLTSLASRPQIDPSFKLEVNGYGYNWSDIGRFVLPLETLDLAATGYNTHSGFLAPSGELIEDGEHTRWVAPEEPGLYQLMVSRGPDVRRLNVFVMVPYDSLKRGVIKGVTLGRYPAESPFPNFTHPRGFIFVTPDLLETRVSPRYTLGEFVPRQPEGFPKYIALREELIIKLEAFTDFVQAKGHKFDKFHLISGFRAPMYNSRNRSGRNSAHVYGGAADILVDADNSGMMDDLNHDGAIDRHDAKLLARYIDEFEREHAELVGGCGWYRRTRYRGPFIHIDVRGAAMRWHQ